MPVHVPKYDELSVKNLWPQFDNDEKLMVFFPDDFANDKGPSREYFFNILNTEYPEYMKQIMDHANSQRMSAESELNKNKSIEIS